MRLVSPEQEEPANAPAEGRVQSPDTRLRTNSAASKLNPINMLNRQPSGDREPRPEKVKKAKQRVQLDDFDSEEDDKKDPFADPREEQKKPAADAEPSGRLSEFPVQISAADANPSGKENAQEKEKESDPHQPPGLTGDTSSQDTSSPVPTPSPDDSPSTNAPSKANLASARPAASPSPTDHAPSSSMAPPSRPAPIPTKEMEVTSPPYSSESSSLPAWSDASLRSYLDDGSEIRDMMTVIHNTSGVVPVGPDHPLMQRLFVEETKTMTQLGGELDSLLLHWLEGKKKRRMAAGGGAAGAGSMHAIKGSR